MKETLRLGAPFSFLPELSVKEDAYLDGKIIHKDSLILVDIPTMHTRPDIWQRPLEFLPERFLPKNPLYKRPDGGQRHPLSYVPFFAGVRACPAENLVSFGARLMFSLFIKYYSFEPVDKA